MRKQGLVYAGRPSFSRLATEAQKITSSSSPTTQTVIDIILGKTNQPSDELVRVLAQALHLAPATVASWVGRSLELNDPYLPPNGSDRLTRKQREAVDHIIRVMIEAEEIDHDTAPTSHAEVSSANVKHLPPGPEDFGHGVAAQRDDE